MAGLFDLLPGQFGILNKIKSLVEEAASISELGKLLTENEAEVGASTVRKIYNYYRTLQPAALDYVSNLGRNELPDTSQLVEAVTNQLSNYSYVVQVNGTPIGNTTPKTYVTVISNRLLTKAEAAQYGFNIAATSEGTSGLSNVRNADVLSITTKPGGTTAAPNLPGIFQFTIRGNQ